MSLAVRAVSVNRGIDPRDTAMIAFGGAGPLHAVAIAREISIPKVIIPKLPGNFLRARHADGGVAAGFRAHPDRRTGRRAARRMPRAPLPICAAPGEAALARDGLAGGNLRFRRRPALSRPGAHHRHSRSTRPRRSFRRHRGDPRSASTRSTTAATAMPRPTSRSRSSTCASWSRCARMDDAIGRWLRHAVVAGSAPRRPSAASSHRRSGPAGGSATSCGGRRSRPAREIVGPAVIEEPNSTTFVAAGRPRQ